MWEREPSESPVKYTEISLEIAVCGRAVVMCLTDSANSSSKGVTGRATAQPPQPACHPTPNAFAGASNSLFLKPFCPNL